MELYQRWRLALPNIYQHMEAHHKMLYVVFKSQRAWKFPYMRECSVMGASVNLFALHIQPISIKEGLYPAVEEKKILLLQPGDASGIL